MTSIIIHARLKLLRYLKNSANKGVNLLTTKPRFNFRESTGQKLLFFRPRTGTFVTLMEASLAWLAGRRKSTIGILTSHAQYQFAIQAVSTGSASIQTLALATLGGEYTTL